MLEMSSPRGVLPFLGRFWQTAPHERIFSQVTTQTVSPCGVIFTRVVNHASTDPTDLPTARTVLIQSARWTGMPLLEYVLAAVVLALVLVIIFQIKIARDKMKSYAAEQVSAYKVNEEKRIQQRVDVALNVQRSVVKGKVWEQIAPHLPEFEYNPADARFLGNPVDYIVFSGMSDGEDMEVVIIDVKTGKSQLNPNQRRIRDAISKGRIVAATAIRSP